MLIAADRTERGARSTLVCGGLPAAGSAGATSLLADDVEWEPWWRLRYCVECLRQAAARGGWGRSAGCRPEVLNDASFHLGPTR